MNSSVHATGFRFRWINAQCFEIVLPNGCHILTDPFMPSVSNHPGNSFFDEYLIETPFSVEDLEGADYVLINHTHGDHILHLQEVIDRFHPVVLCHSAVAVELAKVFDIGLSRIYPVDLNGTYYFDGFSVTTFHGTHHPVKEVLKDGAAPVHTELAGSPDRAFLSAIGGLFNMNFLITTDNNFSIAFVGGDDDGDCAFFDRHPASILFRNKLHATGADYDVAADWSRYLHRTHIPLMVPMHHEKWFVRQPGYTEQLVEDMNKKLAEMGSVSRVLNPRRTKWYTLGLTVTPV